MRIALLHLDLSEGPEERNLQLLQQAMVQAAEAGANWIITPETAAQGYFFTQKGRPFTIPVQPSPRLDGIRQTAAAFDLTVFLGCAEQDGPTGRHYNSCLVIGGNGDILGRHRKVHSHGKGAEGWADKGTGLEPVVCPEMPVGVLVCADAYYGENACRMKDQEAKVIIVPAAWPPGGCGGPPVLAWERCSRESGLPVWICNQTGNGGTMDLRQAESAVVVDGKIQLAYSGAAQAILIFDWDVQRARLESEEFLVLRLEEGR